MQVEVVVMHQHQSKDKQEHHEQKEPIVELATEKNPKWQKIA